MYHNRLRVGEEGRQGLFEEVTWELNPKSRVEISRKQKSNASLTACAKTGGKEMDLKGQDD